MAEELEVIDIDVPAQPAMSLMQVESPQEFIEKATEVANVLADVIRKRKLSVKISGREHVLYEGWTALGALVGATLGGTAIFPVIEWTRPVVDPEGHQIGWEARALAQTIDGRVIAAAESECLRSESKWRTRDDFALRSMAQTRAASKALRQPLGFIMVLAGYDATPTEDMPGTEPAAPKVQDETLLQLDAALVGLSGVARWEEPAVLESARRKWGGHIESFSDLTEAQAQMILTGARNELQTMAAPEDA